MNLGASGVANQRLSLPGKLLRLNWAIVFLVVMMASVGLAMQYSVADGSFSPWARAQGLRFAVSFVGMLIIALIDIRVWRRAAYPVYAIALLLLIGVEVAGSIGMGAQRWIELGPIRVQPSELMKVALVLALARYFHDLAASGRRGIFLSIVPPLLLIALPAALVLKQPDLGTAVLIGFGGIVTMFLAGVSLWFFIATIGAAGGTVYAVFASKGTSWQLLKSYQYDRIAVFIDPSLDPRGAGYHITQSKIAFGSGEWTGAGYLQGPQAKLDFLPEKHTDFIMTVIGEEFGLIGSLGMLGIYMLTIAVMLISAMQIRYFFGRLLAGGVAATFFAYFSINIAMIMGLVPVVGVPMPFVSYGGTSLMVLNFAFGLFLSAQVHGDVSRDWR